MKKVHFITLLIVAAAIYSIGMIWSFIAKDNDERDLENSLEHLKAVPYLSHSRAKADKTKSGVAIHEPPMSFGDYNLYMNRLMDMNGNLIHGWRHMKVYQIFKNGDVLAENRKKKCIGKYNWNGDIVWENNGLRIHHEIAITPENTILTLSKEVHIYNGRKVEFDIVTELDQNGKILSRWSTWENLEHIKKYHKPSRLDKPENEKNPRSDSRNSDRKYDYYHLNSIQTLPETEIGIKDKRFQTGNWLISLRNTNLIIILDQETKKIIWSYGPEKIQMQHMPRMLEKSTILVFDNGKRKRGYSRVIELDPVTKNIVWEYMADPPESFYSRTRGSCQRLPNGNTLIGDSESGRAFEITEKKEIVWEWYDSRINKEGKRKIFYRMTRWPKEYIDKIIRENGTRLNASRLDQGKKLK